MSDDYPVDVEISGLNITKEVTDAVVSVVLEEAVKLALYPIKRVLITLNKVVVDIYIEYVDQNIRTRANGRVRSMTAITEIYDAQIRRVSGKDFYCQEIKNDLINDLKADLRPYRKTVVEKWWQA